MSETITVRIPERLAAWLKETGARIGLSQGQIIRQHLDRARRGDRASKKFMRLAGTIKNGPSDLSTRKGFAKR
ncbi:MAG: hypothetical protein H0W66_03055 [Chthoniobacterales bacterium]|nr:hypothetical protein [Chthoniobacterales bacterium]